MEKWMEGCMEGSREGTTGGKETTIKGSNITDVDVEGSIAKEGCRNHSSTRMQEGAI